MVLRNFQQSQWEILEPRQHVLGMGMRSMSDTCNQWLGMVLKKYGLNLDDGSISKLSSVEGSFLCSPIIFTDTIAHKQTQHLHYV